MALLVTFLVLSVLFDNRWCENLWSGASRLLQTSSCAAAEGLLCRRALGTFDTMYSLTAAPVRYTTSSRSHQCVLRTAVRSGNRDQRQLTGLVLRSMVRWGHRVSKSALEHSTRHMISMTSCSDRSEYARSHLSEAHSDL